MTCERREERRVQAEDVEEEGEEKGGGREWKLIGEGRLLGGRKTDSLDEVYEDGGEGGGSASEVGIGRDSARARACETTKRQRDN